MAEQWKSIDEFDGRYEVSSFGNIRSVNRYVPNHTGVANLKGKTIKQRKSAKGYMVVDLSKNSTHYYRQVHRLVAQAFIPNPQNKPQVNHIDGNKENNSIENLEWCTSKENQKHATKMKLNDHSKYKAGKPEKAVVKIDSSTGNIIERYDSIAKATNAIGYKCKSNIGACCRGLKKSVGGYLWKYESEVM